MEDQDGQLAIVVDETAYDPSNKECIQAMLPENSIVPGRITELADEINRGRTDDWFRKFLKKDPDFKVARRLRLQFWNMYNHYASMENKKPIPITSLYAGIVTPQKWKKILRSDELATFIFTQPTKVKLIQEDLLYEGYRQLEEIMEASIYKKDGAVDPRIVTHKLKIINMIEDRLNGSVVQRTQNYTQQVSKFEGNHAETKEDVLKVREEILKLKRELGKDVEDAEFRELK